ncbi:MAG: pyruvate dehydrogenase complex dihydrolipoamide acetyltransferase [Chitinophagaceae bacterium]|nr:pyruvate dehydrogenase complex dihydrolipoamide acetyltransferase [Chitinophagaceae bacterium]MCW5904241.1 pyruvate dehydrogenase complex dihydrolipoamide acetyltransferase [Chitinophagaceae bacterium]
MAEIILMPRLSDTMTEGVIASWHKNIGDTVKKGEVLAEIETDKATMELESYKEGTLLYHGAKAGEKIIVNDLLCIIGNAGEDVSALISQSIDNSPQTTDNKAQTIPANKEEQAATAIDISKMEEVVLMPRLSDTMTEGVIASWQKNIGDTVKKGEVLAEIETDKATMELESYKEGILLYQGAGAGEKIVVNDLLCIIGKKDTDVNAIVAAAKGGSKQSIDDSPQTTDSQPPTPNLQLPTTETVVNEGRIVASPLAKKIASEKGVDLKFIKGSGDNGRIIKADVDAYKQQSTDHSPQTTDNKPQTSNFQLPTPIGAESFEEVPVSQMRKVIAKRLGESKFSAPHFYLTMSIDMDAAVAARTKLNADGKTKISFNDLVLKATAIALKQHPKVNSSWLGDKIRYNHHIHIGVAVAVDEGLLVPVVRFADTLSLTQITAQVKDYAQKAKDKKLQPADWEGNTFTISNLGMFGIDEFTAIINPPDACILAVGGIAQVPVVKNGTIVPGNVMKVTLSCDHRVVDGATGAAFLQTLKSLLEEPLRMML